MLGKHIRAARQEGKPFNMTSDCTSTGLPFLDHVSLLFYGVWSVGAHAAKRGDVLALNPQIPHPQLQSLVLVHHNINSTSRSAQFEKGKTSASPPFVERPCEVLSCMWSSGITSLQCISMMLRRPFDTLRHATGLRICRLMIDLYSLVFRMLRVMDMSSWTFSSQES